MKPGVLIWMYLAALFNVPGPAGAVDAIDREWEASIAQKLEEQGKTGEVIWCEAGRQRFLTLLKEPLTIPARGAVILLHGMGTHPDWPEVIAPLRTALPESGWSTLSIQLPVLAPQTAVADYGNTVEEAILRIDDSIRLLRERGYNRIVLLGYSFGAAIGARYLAETADSKITGFISISIQARKFLNPTLNILTQIEKITVPFLDVYGSRDNPEVTSSVVDRRLAARKADNPDYQQLEISGADHVFSGYEPRLLVLIRDWLEKMDQAIVGRTPDEVAPVAETAGQENRSEAE